jgi:hypothetical protein
MLNVRSMLQPGKMQEIANEIQKFQIDIVTLQAIHWCCKDEWNGYAKKDVTW